MRYGVKILIACALTALCGCATLGKIATEITPAATKLVTTAVDIAVTAEIIKDPATSALKAAAFKAIATQVLADASNPSVSIAQLQGTLNARLAALAPNPLIAASVVDLVGGLQGALNNAIGKAVGNSVTQQTLVDIQGIASEVIKVCGFYGA